MPTLNTRNDGPRPCLTRKTLESYQNSETVKLREVICQLGNFDISELEKKTERERRHRVLLVCPVGEHPLETTFIRYDRLDGKHEETRIDKIIEVSVTLYVQR